MALSASAGPTSVCDASQPASSDSSWLRNVSLIGSLNTLGCAPAESRAASENRSSVISCVSDCRWAWSTIA